MHSSYRGHGYSQRASSPELGSALRAVRGLRAATPRAPRAEHVSSGSRAGYAGSARGASPERSSPQKEPWNSHWFSKEESDKRFQRLTCAAKSGSQFPPEPMPPRGPRPATSYRHLHRAGFDRSLSPEREDPRVSRALHAGRPGRHSEPSLAHLLLDAAVTGDPLQLEEVLEHVQLEGRNLGAFLATRNEEDATALHIAANRGHVEVCDLLLQKRADVLATEGHGASPLVLSSSRGHEEVVRLLVRYKAQGHQCDRKGRNALHVAALHNPEIVRLLLQHWPELVATQDHQGYNALAFALTNPSLEAQNDIL
ncbi:unnamed protein product, partial [Durusdinium trenchii]